MIKVCFFIIKFTFNGCYNFTASYFFCQFHRVPLFLTVSQHLTSSDSFTASYFF